MRQGNVTFTWGKFPWRLIAAIGLLWFTAWVDLWSKLNWYGQLLAISAITFLVFIPHISVKTDKIKVEKEEDEVN